MEHQIQTLIEIIHQFSDKIESLENKVDDLQCFIQENISKCNIREPCSRDKFPVKSPSISFEKWVDSFVVSQDVLEITCKNGILEGCKQCITDNFQKYNMTIPLTACMRPKQLYVYCIDNNDINKGIWQLYTDEHLNILIQEIWRKILQLFLNDSTNLFEDTDEDISQSSQNYRDICMKKILEMKKNLLQRHSKEILRYLIVETKNRNIM